MVKVAIKVPFSLKGIRGEIKCATYKDMNNAKI